jgi:GNAT superfamily N-acetyltransferase
LTSASTDVRYWHNPETPESPDYFRLLVRCGLKHASRLTGRCQFDMLRSSTAAAGGNVGNRVLECAFVGGISIARLFLIAMMKIAIRPLDKADVAKADEIFRQAFGTFFGLPDPLTFTGDAAIVATRWRANSGAVLAAYSDGALVGSSLATRWGGFGFVGPVSVRPDLWDQGVAKQLMEETVALLDGWSLRQSALFTFPQSPKHIALYQKFGFWPQYLTAVMSKPVREPANAGAWSRYSTLSPDEQSDCLEQCAGLTGKIFDGLDVRPEMRAIADQGLGETILISDRSGVAAFACCHMGKNSEAGTGVTFVKFGAVRPGENAPALFEQLLDACDALAAGEGCKEIIAGVNTARHQAYRQMINRGFRTFLEGVAMLRPNATAYNRPDSFVIDDLR